MAEYAWQISDGTGLFSCSVTVFVFGALRLRNLGILANLEQSSIVASTEAAFLEVACPMFIA